MSQVAVPAAAPVVRLYETSRSKILLKDVAQFENAFKDDVPGGGLVLAPTVTPSQKIDTALYGTLKVKHYEAGKEKDARLQLVLPTCVSFSYVEEEKPYGLFTTDNLNQADSDELDAWCDATKFITDAMVKAVGKCLATHKNPLMQNCKVFGINTKSRRAIKFRFEKGTIQVAEKLERLNNIVSGRCVVEISSFWMLYNEERMTYTIGPNYVLMVEPWMPLRVKTQKTSRREAARLAQGLPVTDEVEVVDETEEESAAKKAKTSD